MTWSAPLAAEPVRAIVAVPGSKSETNRALVLGALATGPSVISNGLEARDTQLMKDALRALGVLISINGDQCEVVPPAAFTGGATIDCGLAGTVMRFVPPVAALADGLVRFDGDQQAYERPMHPLLDALTQAGAVVETETGTLPFTVTGRSDLPGGPVDVDAAGSSQFVSGLLLAGARYARGIEVRHRGVGLVPSRPHLEMTTAMLRERGVTVEYFEEDRWVVSPGPIGPKDVTVEPDLSNAAPFLAAAAITGGSVTVPHWPAETRQPGDRIRQILADFGAEVVLDERGLTVTGTDRIHGIHVDLADASELTPVVAAMAALADSTSHLRGVAHIRGHETDRLAALATELERLGAHVHQTHDGLTIHPRLLGGDVWHTYADHRMAQAGALLGLVVEYVELDDVECTGKTMPDFVDRWTAMLAASDVASDAAIAADENADPARPGDTAW